jgi:hypothetical protein
MQDTPAPRICSVPGCEAPLRASNTIGRCREHAYVPAAGAVCAADGCGQVLRKDNATGFCTPHKRAKGRGPVPKRDLSGRVYLDRTCPDCGDVFTPASATHERCPDCQHRHRLDLRAEREGRNRRDTCSVDGCDAKLRTSNTTGRCSPHRRFIPRAICGADGCAEPLRKDNGTGYCQAHRNATDRVLVRTCAADGCDRSLRADNESGYCKAHAQQTAAVRAYRDRYYADLREESAERYQQRPVCSVDGCTNRLRSDNTSGRCAGHIYVPIPIEWAECSIDGCGARIMPDNPLGRCAWHRSLYWDAGNPAPECGEPGCGKTLYRDNQTGFCHKHRKAWRDAYNQEYYDRNQVTLREYSRQYREEHPEEHRANASAWNAANRAARFASESRRRLAAAAGMDDVDRALSVARRLAIRNDPCFYCGSPETDHVDHYFPIAKGGTDHWWNLVRSCAKCNHAKYDKCGTAFLLLSGG